MTEGWLEVGSRELIEDGHARVVEVDGLRVALIRNGDAVFALSDRCPHSGGSLGAGWVEDDAVVCPLHRWRFRLRDGRCGDVSGYSVARWACDVRDGVVWVRSTGAS